ncbi:MAG: hypothetical protein DRN42_02335 [Thermoplasmata archaeon]|nr:MAG: hypothetical protein DRN42_02335 [Thermoplasmata archaeon]
MGPTMSGGWKSCPKPPKKRRRTPYDEIVELCNLPPEIKELLPRRWERYGDVVILKLPKELTSYEREVGRLYAEVLGANLVLVDEGGVRGLTRCPVVRVIYGEESEAFHKENRLIYNFDPIRIMFSSGNIDERIYVAELLKRSGDRRWVVWDLFAGIGYFSLPAGREVKGGAVVSVEINPLAYYYLIKNLVFNEITDRTIPVLGDNSKVIVPGTADLTISGYFVEEGWEEHVARVCSLLKPEGGLILYHFLAKKKELESRLAMLLKKFSRALLNRNLDVAEHRCRRVKSYAPLVYHYVLEVLARPTKGEKPSGEDWASLYK